MTRLLIQGGTVFDGSGAAPAVADVVVEDGRVVDVGVGLDGDEVFDAGGQAVLPGLFDCHVHSTVGHLDFWKHADTPFSFRFFAAARQLEDTLATGVTTVRDAGGADLGVKQAVESGLVNGPRMRIAVNMISQTGGHNDPWMVSGQCVHTILPTHPGCPSGIADGPDAVRRVAREMLRAGADVLKVATTGGVLSPRDDPRHPHFRTDELEVLVAEARAAGVTVLAHAAATEGIKAALRAGVHSVEHGIFLDDEAIDLFLRNDAVLVPTLVAPRGVLKAIEAGATMPENTLAKVQMVLAAHDDSFRRALDAGVRIAMGTDSGVVPHGENTAEIEAMVELGMPPDQALVAATSTAASLLGLGDELGTLAPGKRADVVVLDGDPLDVKGMGDRVRAVFKEGRLAVDRRNLVPA